MCRVRFRSLAAKSYVIFFLLLNDISTVVRESTHVCPLYVEILNQVIRSSLSSSFLFNVELWHFLNEIASSS